MSALEKRGGLRWMVVAAVALVLAVGVQRQVEQGRVKHNLTWTGGEGKEALEVGLMALGGFRGILADVLWIRAIRHQDSHRYYELKLLCDLIQKLQPTFTQVHAFQAYNMSYNLAYRADTGEDKWFWIRSGLASLERGLKRNERNYALWFELGYQYFDRLGDQKMGEHAHIRDAEMPRIDDLTEEQLKVVWLEPENWTKGRARPQENLRFASYYFWKAMETGTDPVPIRTERQFGQCIERLGHWASKKPAGERKRWDDWGAEDWWVELIRRNNERGWIHEDTVPTNLRFCMYQQMDFFERKARQAQERGDATEAASYQKRADDAFARFQKYFPDDKRSQNELLTLYRGYVRRQPATQD